MLELFVGLQSESMHAVWGETIYRQNCNEGHGHFSATASVRLYAVLVGHIIICVSHERAS